MSSILIACAHPSEVQATLTLLQATPVAGTEKKFWREGTAPSLYRFSYGAILLTGMGSYAALAAITQMASSYAVIWNIGFAGSLKGDIPLGEIVPIACVDKLSLFPLRPAFLEEDPISQSCLAHTLPPLSLPVSGKHLLTVDCPVHHPSFRIPLSAQWDLVDMEGYGIAFAAHTLGKPCYQWKLVSDFSSPEGRRLLHENKEKFSEKIAFHLLDCLENFLSACPR